MWRVLVLLTAIGLAVLVLLLVTGSKDLPVPDEGDDDRETSTASAGGRHGSGPTLQGRLRGEIAGTVRRDGIALPARVEVRRLAHTSVPDGFELDGDIFLAAPVGSGAALKTVKAGQSGTYLVRDLEPDRYEVRATITSGATASAATRIRLPGERVLVHLEIPAGACTLLGRVVHGDGRPWRGLVAAGLKESPRRPVGPSAVRTDELGRFRIRGLEPGLVRVSCLRAGAFRYVGNLVRIPYDGEIQIVVDRDAALLSGRVLADDDGSPVGGATVTVTGDIRGNRWCSVRTRTSPDGRFGVRVLPRSRTVTVRAVGFAPMHREIDGEVESVEIRLDRAAVVRGRVLSAGDGTPRAGVTVTCIPLEVTPADAGARITSDAAGRYEFRARPSGLVQLWAQGGGWISPGLGALEPGGSNPLVRTLDPGSDAEVNLIVVPAARVRGRVQDEEGAGLAGIPVRATPRAGREDLPLGTLDTVSGPEGTFELDGLVPDLACRIRAAPPGREPVFGSVTGSSGETIEAVLVVPTETVPPRWLDLLVVERESGEPVAGARVFAGGLKGRTSHGGRARIGPLRAGRISVWVHHPDYALLRQRPVLEASFGVVTQTVRLRRGLAVAGRVLLPDGGPLENGSVSVESLETQEGGAPDASGSGYVTVGGLFRAGGLLAGKVEVKISGSHDGKSYRVTTVVDAGSEDLVLTTERHVGEEGRTLYLRVVDARGEPVRTATVDVHFRAEGRSWSDWHDVRDGRARISYWGGDCEVRVCVRGARSSGTILHGPISIDGREVEIRLPVEAVIAGSVRESDGRGVAGARIEARPVFGQELEFEAVHSVAYTDARGAFRLAGLGTTEYRISVTPPAAFLPVEPMTAKAGKTDLALVLRRGAVVRITVADQGGVPLSGALVAIEEEDADRERGGGAATTRRDGVARIEGVDRSLTHRLVVAPPGDRSDLLKLERERWRAADERVTLIRGMYVAGIVRDPDGGPATGIMVHAWPAGGKGEWKEVARDGSFRFGPYAAGPVNLWARPKDVPLTRGEGGPVSVAAGRDDVVLTCGAGTVITLRILNWHAGFGPARVRYSQRAVTRWAIVGGEGTAILRVLAPAVPFSVRVGPVGDGLYLLLRDFSPSASTVDVRLVQGGTVTGHLRLPPGEFQPEVRLDGGGFTLSAAVEPRTRSFRFTGVPDGGCVVTCWIRVGRERIERHAWTRAGESVVLDFVE